MPVDERSRHQLYRKLDELMGPQEATTLMELLPPSGWGDVARKQDLEALRVATRQDLTALREDLQGFRREWKQDLQGLRLELHADMDRLARRLVTWMSSMTVALTALAFAAGRFV